MDDGIGFSDGAHDAYRRRHELLKDMLIAAMGSIKVSILAFIALYDGHC